MMNRPIRILILFASTYPHAGGGRETGLYNLSRSGQKLFAVDVVTLQGRSRQTHFVDAERFASIHPVFSWQGVMSLRGYNSFARRWDARGCFDRIAHKAAVLSQASRPDVVMSFDTGPTAKAAMHIAQRCRAVSAINMRAFFADEIAMTNPYLQDRVSTFQRIEMQVISDVDLILCNGEDTYEFCVGKNGRTKPTVTVHNGVDTDIFRPDVARPYRDRFRASPEDIVFISNNPIRDIKGPQDAIRAMALLPEVHRNRARLVFLGKGDFSPYRKLAEELGVAGRVEYLGFVRHAELSPYLSSADIAIHPVLFSAGTTHASLETLASGLPQISYDSASLRTTCQNGNTGILVDAGSIDGLANAMRTLMDDAQLRSRFAASARVHSEEFSWSNYVARYAKAIEEVLPIRETV